MNKMRINRIIVIGLISYLCVGVSAYYQPSISVGTKRPVTFQEVHDYFYSRGVYQTPTPAPLAEISQDPGSARDVKMFIRHEGKQLLTYLDDREKLHRSKWDEVDKHVRKETLELRRFVEENMKNQDLWRERVREYLRKETLETREFLSGLHEAFRGEYDRLTKESNSLREDVRIMSSYVKKATVIVAEFIREEKLKYEQEDALFQDLQRLSQQMEHITHELDSTHGHISRKLDQNKVEVDPDDSDSDSDDEDSDDEDSDSDDEDSDDEDSDDEDSDVEDSDDDDVGRRFRSFLKEQFAEERRRIEFRRSGQ